MIISEFISKYRNHPVLFVGTGVSLRYFSNSYTWDGLLQKICFELKGNIEYYLDIKSQCEVGGKYNYAKVAYILEQEFNSALIEDRNGKFKEVNDIFYEQMKVGINLSRLKIYICKMLDAPEIREEKAEEVAELKKARKNIGSIITTNYDCFIENVFNFIPLIGNDILLSNPYGSVYKIHGCVSRPDKIIITESDYEQFDKKFELIRAQLLSIFIHNPIIFIGYGIGDENIKTLLRTIFTYVEPNSNDAKKIRDNFLLVEHKPGFYSHEISEHDIDLEGFGTIRINKIKTDDFIEIYRSLSTLSLPISAMDVRKVQSIVKEIYSGGDIKVHFTEDLDALNNSDKIMAIGSHKTITYQFQTSSEMMHNYFDIIDEANNQLLMLINKFSIPSTQWFPVFGFGTICKGITYIDKLMAQQKSKIDGVLATMPCPCKSDHKTIEDIMTDEGISTTNKVNAIIWALNNDKLILEDVEVFLRVYSDKSSTPYRKLLCSYDYKKYSVNIQLGSISG